MLQAIHRHTLPHFAIGGRDGRSDRTRGAQKVN